jgi:hypothetical protein
VTVQAELQFVTDAARVASEAAASVARFRDTLGSLAGLSGMKVDLGANIATQIDQATESATRLAGVLAKGAADARKIGTVINGKAVSPEAAQAKAVAKEAARSADQQAKAAAKSVHIREHGEQKLAAVRLQNEGKLAAIEAKRKAQVERDAKREEARKLRGPLPVTEETTSGIGGAARSILEGGGLKGALGAFGGKGAVVGAIADLVTRAASAVADITVSFGKAVVKAQAFREDLSEAFAVVGRSRENGDRIMGAAMATADRLGASRAETAKQFLDLATKGFDAQKTDEIIGSLKDLSTIDPSASTEGLIKVIGKIQATGRLNQETLNELSTFGLEQSDVLKEIGKVLGKNDKDVLKALSTAGGIRGLGVDPILKAINAQVGGGPAGEKAAAKANRNLSSLLERFAQIPENVLIDVDVSSGLDGIKTGLKEVLEYFQAGTESGERVRKVVGDVFNALAEGLFGKREGDKEGIRGTLDTIVDIAEKGTPAIKGAAEAVGTLARAFLAITSGDTSKLDGTTKRIVGVLNLLKELGLLLAPGGTFGPGGLIQPILDILGIDADASGVRKWVDAVAGLLNPANIFRTIKASFTGGDPTLGNPILTGITGMIQGAVDGVGDAASAIGTNIIDGIVGGINGGLQRVSDAASSMASGALSAAKSALGIASPSRLMRDEVGLMAGEGLAIGYERSIPRVLGAAEGLADAGLRGAMSDPFPLAIPPGLSGAMAPAGGASFGGGPGPVQFVFAPQITIQGGASDGEELARIIQQKLQEYAPQAITAWLEAMAGR